MQKLFQQRDKNKFVTNHTVTSQISVHSYETNQNLLLKFNLLKCKNKTEQKTVIKKIQAFKIKSPTGEAIHVTADSSLLEVTAGQNWLVAVPASSPSSSNTLVHVCN